MIEKYKLIDREKLPDNILKELDSILKETKNFENEEYVAIYEDTFNQLFELIEKDHPDAIMGSPVEPTKEPTPTPTPTPEPKPDDDPEPRTADQIQNSFFGTRQEDQEESVNKPTRTNPAPLKATREMEQEIYQIVEKYAGGVDKDAANRVARRFINQIKEMKNYKIADFESKIAEEIEKEKQT